MDIFGKAEQEKSTQEVCTGNEFQNEKNDLILKLLTLFERLNHYVKEGDWYESDRSELYALKDRFLTQMYEKRNMNELDIELLYVPYYKYSNTTKDRAGDLMRADGMKHSFEYYLGQVNPSSMDIELPEKATIEMNIHFDGREWCFHIPQNLTANWGVDVKILKKKTWMSGKDFHSQQSKLMKQEAEMLLEQLKRWK